jgi:oligogalacturonide lyase
MENKKIIFSLSLAFAWQVLFVTNAFAQPILETGGQKMPAEWIDKDTKHKVVKLSANLLGNSSSFYFHNNPFIGNGMIFYNNSKEPAAEVTDMKREEPKPTNINNRQIFAIDLKTNKTRQLTFRSSPMNGEVVCEKTKTVFYQVKDSVFSLNIKTGKDVLVYIFPKDFRSSISTVNVNGTLLAGAWATDAEKEIFKKNPNKSSYFDAIYDAHLPKTIFTIDVKTGVLNKIFTDSAWLNHLQFSTTDPYLLSFCHEGPWHKVNRIWHMNVATKKIVQVHYRSMPMEIWGHEWFGKSGKTMWFDLQQPKGKTFFVSGYDVATGKEIKYSLARNDWSVHYNSNSTETLFAGDGGDPGAVAKAPDGQWINLFTPNGDTFDTEKLVNMKHHNYKLEPNVHFSPDDKWIIFRANFEGESNVYAVEIKQQ